MSTFSQSAVTSFGSTCKAKSMTAFHSLMVYTGITSHQRRGCPDVCGMPSPWTNRSNQRPPQYTVEYFTLSRSYGATPMMHPCIDTFPFSPTVIVLGVMRYYIHEYRGSGNQAAASKVIRRTSHINVRKNSIG
jgi:hypothetical protein